MRPVRDASHDYLPNLEYNFLVSCKIQSTLTLPGRAARVDQPRAPFSFSPLLVSFALTPPFCRPLLLLPGIYTPPAPGICQPATWQPTANQTGMKRQREDPRLTEMKRERILRERRTALARRDATCHRGIKLPSISVVLLLTYFVARG